MSCIASAVSRRSASGSTCRKVRPSASKVRDALGGDQPVRRVVGADREQVGVAELGHRRCPQGMRRASAVRTGLPRRAPFPGPTGVPSGHDPRGRTTAAAGRCGSPGRRRGGARGPGALRRRAAPARAARAAAPPDAGGRGRRPSRMTVGGLTGVRARVAVCWPRRAPACCCSGLRAGRRVERSRGRLGSRHPGAADGRPAGHGRRPPGGHPVRRQREGPRPCFSCPATTHRRASWDGCRR